MFEGLRIFSCKVNRYLYVFVILETHNILSV